MRLVCADLHMIDDASAWREQHALVDIADGDQVLDFAYAYLRKLRRAPTDSAVREVTTVLARCDAGLISYAVLEAVVDCALRLPHHVSKG